MLMYVSIDPEVLGTVFIHNDRGHKTTCLRESFVMTLLHLFLAKVIGLAYMPTTNTTTTTATTTIIIITTITAATVLFLAFGLLLFGTTSQMNRAAGSPKCGVASTCNTKDPWKFRERRVSLEFAISRRRAIAIFMALVTSATYHD